MKKIILLAAAALSLVACNTEDFNIEDPVAAQISATIGESGMSRASNDTWDAGDSIGVTMSGRYTNLKYITEAGNGEFDGKQMYFKNKVETVSISAYYPYYGSEDQMPGVIEASTTSEHQTDDAQKRIDFLYAAKENVSGAEPDIKLAFSHRMSKLSLTFVNGNAGADVSKLKSCMISGLLTDGTFNTSTGVCMANSDSQATDLNVILTPASEKTNTSLILFPQSLPGKVMLHITDSEDQEYSCELKFTDNTLSAGYDYQFNIKVNKTELVIDKSSIAEWFEEGHTADAESE